MRNKELDTLQQGEFILTDLLNNDPLNNCYFQGCLRKTGVKLPLKMLKNSKRIGLKRIITKELAQQICDKYPLPPNPWIGTKCRDMAFKVLYKIKGL